MAKDPPAPPHIPDKAERLIEELRRRGMSEAEIAAGLRKKKRARVLEFNAVKTPHLMTARQSVAQSSKASRRAGRTAPTRDLCTVDEAAERLKLHPKTVLRFIKEGRLKANRIGKAYRILRTDLEALAGLPPSPEPLVEDARATSIVEIPGVSVELAAKWARTITAALNSRAADSAFRADVIHDSERSHLKIVVVGPLPDTVNLLALIRVWTEQLTI